MKKNQVLLMLLCILVAPSALKAQSLYVGSNTSGNTTNFTSGTNSYGNIYVGYTTNASSNTLGVLNTNTILVVTSTLTIGVDGAFNSLIISNGGNLTGTGSGSAVIGDSPTASNNSALITGTNSSWNINGDLAVGNDGSFNSLIISNGATVTNNNGYVNVATTAFSNSILVTGSNSSWVNNGGLSLGTYGPSNQLTIANGGLVVSSSNSYIGNQSTAFNNSVLVTGANSTWSNSGALYLGNSGDDNTLVISNGGTVIINTAYVGSSSNTIIVTGSNSVWSNAGDCYIGYNHSDHSYNTLIISNGGTIIDHFADLGDDGASSNNTAIVTGVGSLWSNTTGLEIGLTGYNNSLVVSNGGTVYSAYGMIGDYVSGASNNTVQVTGSNSLWTNAGTLTIGYRGNSNTLTIASGGMVAASNVVIASQTGSGGELDFGSYGGSDAAGTLETASIAFGSGTGTINFNQTNSLTLTSAISGSGTIQQLGSGTTILSGDSSCTGFIKVYSGTLVGASSNAFGTSTLSLDGGNVTISNAMTINALDWESNNSIITIATPGTSVLNATGSATTSSLTNYFALGTIDNNTNLILTTIATNDFLNTLEVSGITNASIIEQSVGGTNFYYSYISAGSDLVVTGTETISSNTTLGNVSFSTNSTLVINGGITLTVTNNYTSTNSGTLDVTFGQSTPLVVSNQASLAGGLVVHGGTFDGNVRQLITAGSISRSFSSITGDNPSRYRYRGVCVGDPGYYIVTAPASYTIVAANQNQVNVASALNTFTNGVGDYQTVSTDLDYLTDPQYPNAFNQISPALYTTLATVAFNSAIAQYNEMVQRLGNVRVAGVGFSSMGIDNSPIMDDSKNPKSNGKDVLIPAADNHWGFFVDGNGIFANVNIANQLPGYSAEGGGVTIGSDYKWNKEFSTGLYAGYEGFQSKQSGGNFMSDNGSRFGAFGTYQRGGLFVNGILGGDSHSYFVKRGIQFQGPSSIAPALNRTANSSPTAGELDSMLATGYDVKRGNFTFGPITSLQYTYFGLQPFTETGAQSLDLSVQNANANSMVYSLGSHCFYNWQASKNVLVVPQINLAWQHEFLQNPYALDSALGNGALFTYMSTTPLRDSLYTGIGFTVNFDKKYDASFFYNASACNPDLVSQNFFVSLGTRF